MNDGEEDFHLIQPRRVHRGVHHDGVGELFCEPVDRLLAAVRGAVVHDPEHPVRRLVGLLGHDLPDQRGERNDTGGVLAAAVDLRPVHVVRGEVGDRAATVVVVVDPHRPGLTRWQGGVAAAPGLDGGLLVGGDHIVVRAQRFPVPHPLVQVQYPLRPGLEVGVGDEDPRLVLPGFEGVLGQQAAHGGR